MVPRSSHRIGDLRSPLNRAFTMFSSLRQVLLLCVKPLRSPLEKRLFLKLGCYRMKSIYSPVPLGNRLHQLCPSYGRGFNCSVFIVALPAPPRPARTLGSKEHPSMSFFYEIRSPDNVVLKRDGGFPDREAATV